MVQNDIYYCSIHKVESQIDTHTAEKRVEYQLRKEEVLHKDGKFIKKLTKIRTYFGKNIVLLEQYYVQ